MSVCLLAMSTSMTVFAAFYTVIVSNRFKVLTVNIIPLTAMCVFVVNVAT